MRLPVEVDTALAAARARRRDIFAMHAAASPPPARNETRLLEQRFWFVVAGLQHILASLLPCYEQQIDSILKVEYSFWWTMYEISCCKPVNAVRWSNEPSAFLSGGGGFDSIRHRPAGQLSHSLASLYRYLSGKSSSRGHICATRFHQA